MRSDEEADFAGLMDRQWRFAWRVAWAVLRNRHDAEDVAQEVFLKLLRTRAWRALSDEKAFVARVTWRAAVDRLRQRSASKAEKAEEMVDTVRDPTPGPEETVATANWEGAVHRLIDSLPEELRQPLALSVEMNSREIAMVMGIAEGTVRTRLMRARQILREKMVILEERRYARG